jgi:group I intron endonuclease
MNTGIYIIQNKKNKKLYVGSAVDVEKRWHNHKSDLRNNKHHSPRLQHSWNKHGEENFEFLLIEPVKDLFHLVAIEQTFIDYYKCYESHKGYNICSTAGSQLGMKRSEESKRKMSEKRKDFIKKNGLSKQQKDAWKKAVEARNGIKHTEEAKKKMSKAKFGRGKGYSLNKNTNKYLAQITIYGKTKTIGYYNTEEEARAAYIKEVAYIKELENNNAF